MRRTLLPSPPTPAPVPSRVAPDEQPLVSFDQHLRAVRILPIGFAKPDHAAVVALTLGVLPTKARALCADLPELATVRGLQAAVAEARRTLDQVLAEIRAADSRIQVIRQELGPRHFEELDRIERGREAAQSVVGGAMAEVERLQGRLDLALYQARRAMVRACEPLLGELHTELQRRAGELTSRVRDLITPELVAAARELSAVEHARMEVAPDAPLLQQRFAELIDTAALAVLTSPA